MKNSKTSVELIPWAHEITSLMQEDCMEFIRSHVPRHSSLAVEISLPVLTLYQNALRTSTSPAELISKVSAVTLSSPYDLACLQVIHECERKQIKIQPLDIHLKRIPNPRGKNPALAQAVRREEAFVRQLIGLLRSQKKPLFALIGAGHAWIVHEKLEKLGVPSRLRTDILRERELVEKTMRMDKRARESIERGDRELTAKIMREWGSLNDLFKENPFTPELVTKTLDPFFVRKTVQQGRWTRRMIRSKGRTQHSRSKRPKR